MKTRALMAFLCALPSVAAAQDADGDGVPDAIDACPGFDDRLDHDLDALPDACELQPVGTWWDWRVHLVGDAAQPTDIAAADIDGDGAPDLVQLHRHGANLRLNLGALAFGPEDALYSQGANIARAQAVDLDGDGDRDVLYADTDRDLVAVLENVCGTLVRGTVVATGLAEPWDIHPADLDADGDLDVVVTTSTTGPWAFEQLPDGSFAPGILTHPGMDSARDIAVGDLDGNGVPDVVSGSLYDRGQLYWLGWSAWSFTPTTIVGVQDCDGYYTCGSYYSAVHVADMTADGLPDVLGADDDELLMHRNLGGGAAWSTATLSPYFESAQEFYDADFDADGDQDLLVAGLGGLAWFQNNFPGFVQVPISNTLGNFWGMVYEDLDADGIDDIAGSNLWYPQIEVLAGGPGGAFSSAFSATPNTPEQPESVELADLDADGDLDLVVGSSGSGGIEWRENLGPTGFGPRQVVASLAGVVTIEVVDLDGDGNLDVLAGSEDDGIHRIRATGPAVFGAAVAVGSGDPTHDVHAVDLDQDGDLDLLSTGFNWILGHVRWHRNDGGGVYTTQPDIAVAGFTVTDARAADLDGDGDLDIAWISPDDGAFWSQNLGGGAFAVAQPLGQVLGAFGDARIDSGDFDGDGDLDLVWVASRNGGPQQWTALNLGGGAFAPAVALDPGGPEPHSVVVADLDQDGALDLVVSGWGWREATVWLYRGDGAGGFDPRLELSHTTGWLRELAVGDTDGDGDPDIAFIATSTHAVGWLENPHIAPPDADGDGLTLVEELARSLDPTNPDTDGNGITDGAEVFGQGGPTVAPGGGTTGTPPPCQAGTATGGAGTGTGTGSPATATGTGTGATGTGAPTGTPADGDTGADKDSGCGCGASGPASAVWLALLPLALRRRR